VTDAVFGEKGLKKGNKMALAYSCECVVDDETLMVPVFTEMSEEEKSK
jgi:hypothetical protein